MAVSLKSWSARGKFPLTRPGLIANDSRQCGRAAEPAFCLGLARAWVAGKVENQRTLLRRSSESPGDSQPSFGDLKLDPDRHGVRAGEQLVELTRTEYQLLELLMLNPRRVLPHGLIYERVWGYDFGPSSNALRVYIGYLRRKLAELNAPDVIHNVRGVGYVLREP